MLIGVVKLYRRLRLIDLILALTVHLPLRHSHCTRARFTVLVTCSDELYNSLMSTTSPAEAGCQTCEQIGNNNYTATDLGKFTSSYCGRRFATCDC